MKNIWTKFDKDFDSDLDLEPFKIIGGLLSSTLDELEFVSDCGDAPDSFWAQLEKDTVYTERYREVGDSIISVLELNRDRIYVEQRCSEYPGGTVSNIWRKRL